MKKLICALIGAAALVASATTYIQTSSTGTAPWRPVKDSVSQAHLADSARHAPPSAYADSSRASGLADSAKRAGWAPRADSSRAAGISDTAKKAGTAANSLALGGIPAAGYGTLAQDTAISKKVASDTATVLRTGIASAITTSEAYATARISDSLTANARAWTTLMAAKSSIHDTATVLRTYIGSASTTGNAATATKLTTARTIATSGDVTGTPTAFDGTANITIPTSFANSHLTGINQDLATTSSPTFSYLSLSNRLQINSSTWASGISQDGLQCDVIGYYNTWDANKLFINTYNNGVSYGAARFAGVYLHGILTTPEGISTTTLNASGLITANGGITGSLTGTATNALSLGGVAAANYGTLAQDTLISKKVTGDTASVLRGAMGAYLPLSGGSMTGGIVMPSGAAYGSVSWPGGQYVYGDASGLLYLQGDTRTSGSQYVTEDDTVVGSLKVFGNIIGTLTGSITGNASTAGKLATPRTISATGDGTWSASFDGSANATGTLTLASLLTAGSAGSATSVPTLTWDAKGRLTAVGSAAISIPHTQINDWSTATSSFLTGNQSISLTGAVTGSGATSIVTTFANSHLAGIDQDLTTTSSPTFVKTTIAGANYTVNASASSFAAIYGSSIDAAHIAFTWALDGTQTYVNATTQLHFDIGSIDYATLTSSLFAVTPPSTFTGLITANGGIAGNLTGHASLDIPLTGSSAITGSLTPSITSMSDLGTLSKRWGSVYAVEFSENGELLANKYAALTANGGLDLAKNLQSAIYTITSSDQGKMVISNSTLNLPSFSAGTNVGFWCLVNWHVGGGTTTFGPTASGTTWILRGQYIDVSTSTPFTGVVSWDGYNWYAN